MIRCVIIDDEPRGINVLKKLLENNCPGINVIATSDKPQDGIDIVKQNVVDILFLDIKMPEMTGFEFLSHFNQPYPFKVIFTTAYDNHGIEAIKKGAFDYLLKPISIEHLQNSIARYQSLKNATDLLLTGSVKKYQDKISLSTIHGYDFINTSDIIWIQASEAYSIFHLTDNRKITTSGSLRKFEEVLDPAKFFRIHHSHIINSAHLVKYVRTKQAYVIMSNGIQLDVSQRKRDVLNEVI